MTSDLDDQQLSSMQSTSEFGDSRRECRQVECCVHGRPCAIASKLSRAMGEEADRESTSSTFNKQISGYESVYGKNKPRISAETISYGLHKKVEREALDVPLKKWNYDAPHSTSSSFSVEPIITSAGVSESPPGPPKNVLKEGHRNVERHSLSGTVDAPLMGKMKQQSAPRERRDDGYEMMRPVSSNMMLAPPPVSGEQLVRTARTNGSVEMPPSTEAYIGVMTASQAEEQVTKPSSFKLYHMLPKIESLNSVLPSLGLYIIYRSGKGQIYHYPIKECKQYVDYSRTRSKLAPVANLQVEYGDRLAPRFFTLDALVSYYSVYVHLREVDGEYVADIFPVSGMQPTSTSHRRVPRKFH